uniref:NADH-plastoquinone oxidoreductase subunit K n=1 Tax=Paphiopedilum victoria-mariae TaxID=296650 RepID=UPI001BEE6326|nr:NADH-plastoquinone oxidoreductase subunit K [Paphiopedilum victoria-mariae]QUV74864.1 NADH-plastoquinone oxidoreductase subunit K [Paphiopedilum victoria-mariae]
MYLEFFLYYKEDSFIDAITKLRKKISQKIFEVEDRTVYQQENRCFTTNHKVYLRHSTNTGNSNQGLLYQLPSTSEIPFRFEFEKDLKSKGSVSSYELVNQAGFLCAE